MTIDDAPNRLTLSRDALRADLAEMELRLRVWIGEQLTEKADIKALYELERRVGKTEELTQRFGTGDFTPAQQRAFTQLMDANLKQHMDTGWTRRQRWIAVAALLVSVTAVVLSTYIALHYAHPTRTPTRQNG